MHICEKQCWTNYEKHLSTVNSTNLVRVQSHSWQQDGNGSTVGEWWVVPSGNSGDDRRGAENSETLAAAAVAGATEGPCCSSKDSEVVDSHNDRVSVLLLFSLCLHLSSGD